MSTYLYLTCLDHDPPLRAESESGQHLYDLPDIRTDIRDRDALVRLWDDGALGQRWTGFPRVNSLRFLSQHRTCRIGIVDEYGETHPLEES